MSEPAAKGPRPEPATWEELLDLLRRSDLTVREVHQALQLAEETTEAVARKVIELQEGLKAMIAAIALQPKIDSTRLTRDFARFNLEFLPKALAEFESARAIATARASARKDDVSPA